MERYRRIVGFAFVAGLWLAMSSITAKAARNIVDCEQESKAGSYQLPPGRDELQFVSHAKESAWIVVRELGQSVKFGSPQPSEAFSIGLPLRFGWSGARIGPGIVVRVGRVLKTNAQGRIEVRLFCRGPVLPSSNTRWLIEASRIFELVSAPSPPAQTTAVLRSAGDVFAAASTAPERALAKHLVAHALWINGRLADSVQAFADAEQASAAANDPRGAFVAFVARIESLRNLGKFREVLDLTDTRHSGFPGDSYWRIRLQNSRCIALRYVNQAELADQCFRGAIPRLLALGETPEYVEMLANHSQLQFARGELGAAKATTALALRELASVEIASLKGRVHYNAAALALRTGQLGEFFDHAEAALTAFSKENWQLWEASMFLELASVYQKLGAVSESYASLDEAETRIASSRAFAQTGLALLVASRLELSNGNNYLADLYAAGAGRIFKNLNMRLEGEVASLLRAETALSSGRLTREELNRNTPAEGESRYANEWLFLAARLSLQSRRWGEVESILPRLRGGVQTLRDEIRMAETEARYKEARGDLAQAQKALSDGVSRINLTAQNIGDPLLRYLVSRQYVEMQSLGVQVSAQMIRHEPTRVDAGPSPSLEALWYWLRWRDAVAEAGSNSTRPDAANAVRFDAAVGEELLEAVRKGASKQGETTQRELLALLAQRAHAAEDAPEGVSVVSLAQVQARIPPGSILLAFVDEGTSGSLLRIAHDRIGVIPTDSPGGIRETLDELNNLLHSPESSLQQIDALSARLSAQLLAAFRADPPQRLYFLASESLPDIPWELLTWPGEQRPLLDSASSITYLYPGNRRTDEYNPNLSIIEVIASAQTAVMQGALPELRGVSDESSAIIRSVEGNYVVRVHDERAATRESVLTSLARKGGVVHIAAHGVTQSSRVGYSGVWLEPSDGEQGSTFLSWLDVLSHGVNADLVVLDACRLGADPNAVAANMGFANAVVRAGARQVVAASWATSDSAAAIWVSAFYKSFTADAPGDVAHALRSAKLRLRSARAYRHPYYWAGLRLLSRDV